MRKARFDRWPWITSGVLLVIVIWLLFRCIWVPVRVTTVYLVRHGERQDSSANSPLSMAGETRAMVLSHVLRNEGITAVFVTERLRTQQTGAPAAAQVSVTPIPYSSLDAQSVVDQILANHLGGRVLVVGHSNTVDDIAAGLGAAGVAELTEDQFDRLFVIHRLSSIVHLDPLRYGAETP